MMVREVLSDDGDIRRQHATTKGVFVSEMAGRWRRKLLGGAIEETRAARIRHLLLSVDAIIYDKRKADNED
jgi:hypothetical protein